MGDHALASTADAARVGEHDPAANAVSGPDDVVWDITYACPLRCIHCYSESGRRASRRLGRDALLRVADAIISLNPRSVALAGGEPLLVSNLFEVAERISRANIGVILYTSGWALDPALAERIVRTFYQVVVSVDGATAEVHDRIRRRAGSFDHAMNALSLPDEAVGGAQEGRQPAHFGIECVVTRSNFHQLERFCSEVAPRFPRMRFLSFGAAVPSGLASRASFAERELLSDAQVDLLRSRDLASRLQSLAPATVRVSASDNQVLQLRPDLVAQGRFAALMQVEPDGAVRAMPIYEGVVGNLRTDPADLLWKRAVARWSDPFVQQALAGARTMTGRIGVPLRAGGGARPRRGSPTVVAGGRR